MTSPTKQPRKFAKNARDFGRNQTIEWREETDDLTGLIAAQLQSQLCHRIGAAIQNHPDLRTVEKYAKIAGRSANQTNRVLRGESRISIRDLAAARRILDNADLGISLLEPSWSQERNPMPQSDPKQRD